MTNQSDLTRTKVLVDLPAAFGSVLPGQIVWLSRADAVQLAQDGFVELIAEDPAKMRERAIRGNERETR